ncbi:MAG TPA: TraB/GumN family protein [Chthoniobacterales bacterium]
MRFLRLLPLLLVLFAASCSTPSAPQKSTGKSILWRVQSPTNTVYLMGSIHVLPKTAYPLKPALRQAFSDSQCVIFEIELGKGQKEKALEESFGDGLYPAGKTLSQHLKPETLAMLKTLLPYFEIKLEQLEPMRPWLVSDLLMSLFLASNGYRSDIGLDMHYFKEAQKKGKPTGGLEKVAAQTAPFRQFTDAEADEYLRETIASLPFTGLWFSQMVTAWQTGDVKALDLLINRSAQNHTAFYKSIFEDRNNAWMPKIRSFIGGQENVLVVVGSGHLIGRTGVVEQLRRAGYTVEQM